MAERTPRPIRALPTEYAGILFRSRTEARWAHFYDALNITWEYEREGFDIDGVNYLPDFWLPEQERWVEVKGVRPTLLEQEKCQWLADGTGHPALMVWGEPTPPDVLMGLPNGEADQALVFTSEWDDHSFWWCVCPYCGFLDTAYQGRSARLRCRCVAIRHTDEDRSCTFGRPLLEEAYAAARRAFTGPDFLGKRTDRYEPAAS